MAFPNNPAARQPKGDHDRRIDLGLSIELMAAEAGVTIEELRKYETTGTDQDFDLTIAERVGGALERLEANPPASQPIKT